MATNIEAVAECRKCGDAGYRMSGEWFHNDGFFSCYSDTKSPTFEPRGSVSSGQAQLFDAGQPGVGDSADVVAGDEGSPESSYTRDINRV